MKWLGLVAAALAVVACGGKAAHNLERPPDGSAGASNVAGSANAAGSSSAGLGGEGGAAGSGLENLGGAAGAAGAGLSEAGAAGQASLCVGLECLAGAELLYVPDRQWQRPTVPVDTTEELSEADYQAFSGPAWLAKFSTDALSVDLTPVAGGTAVHGTRDQTRAGRAWFDLTLFAGGRFVVRATSGELHAEYTTYGSGMPIISSTRGLLEEP